MSITSQTGSARRRLRTPRLFAAIGASAAIALLAAGCAPGGGGDGSGEGTSIELWLNHSAEEAEQIEALVDQFEAANDDIDVSVLNVADVTQYYTKIKTAAVGNDLPDVYYSRTWDTESNVSRGWQKPLDALLERDRAEVDPDDFWPAQVSQMSAGDELYGLPYDFSNYAVYVNVSMFEEAGIPVPTDDWTWDEFYEIASQFVVKDGSQQSRWGALVPMDGMLMRGVFESNGGSMFTEDLSESVIDSPENVATLTQIADQMEQGVIPVSGATPAGVDPFSAELVAMAVNGSWATQTTRAAVEDKFEWDVVRLPKGSTGERAVSTAGGYWGLSPSTQQEDAAWELVKWLASPDAQRVLIVDPTRSVPGRQSSTEEWVEVAASSDQPPANIDVFRQQMGEDAVNWSYPTFWPEFGAAWGNRIARLGNGGDPAEILRQVEEETNLAAERAQ